MLALRGCGLNQAISSCHRLKGFLIFTFPDVGSMHKACEDGPSSIAVMPIFLGCGNLIKFRLPHRCANKVIAISDPLKVVLPGDDASVGVARSDSESGPCSVLADEVVPKGMDLDPSAAKVAPGNAAHSP
ncbi:hypothetical protein Nepgr_032927 [Nepenthes gracilis]|uniref:Uncharacterized protein n=1 Tax=Nepenthes gracilis TaxID=150966 RepID=A0AAD3TL17_NEPGR|nr:hypothetical protein Nepgr_032927 [Nepenthes gracilis]